MTPITLKAAIKQHKDELKRNNCDGDDRDSKIITRQAEIIEKQREALKFVANMHPDGNPIFAIEKAKQTLSETALERIIL